MIINLDGLVVRQAVDGDAQSVADLFLEEGNNPYGWNQAKWYHYYRDYPEGAPISLVAEISGKVVGHYGLLPIRLGMFSAMLGLHAYVSKHCRGLNVIAALMKEADRHAITAGASAICGFANPQFAMVKKTFFKWKTPFWMGFKSGLVSGDLLRDRAPFFFSYSVNWFDWRFGERSDAYISRYITKDGIIKKQLLKVYPGSCLPGEATLRGCEGWSKDSIYTNESKDDFCQPFSVKAYDPALIEAGIYEAKNWFIEMGDSDTFVYVPY